ncbi:DUF4912 domain-containing protein [Phormidesmis priestleyi]|uniref:DUF4912 domain-containing protein n=1 Tax=Phormidesmis priestleyi TaxID=268141 RepID=UPI00083A76A4
MLEKKDNSIIMALLAAIVAASQPFAISAPIVLAQAAASSPTAFPLPTAVPTGTTVRIDGSSSMASANQALKQRFEAQFPGTSVTVGYGGTPSALQAVLDGKADIAAIGRVLTPQEKAQGLVAVPLSREKIAIVVGSNNPFNGSITDQQFAKIFRGEITDWSQIGGSSGKIRVLDRPEISDTRQALSNYPVFKTAPFTSGATTTRLSEDSTASLISQLGADGIGYTIANQARKASGLKVLLMHNRLPTDPRYPFSQPLVYVYKGTNPSPAIAAFLGYASAPTVQQAIQSAQVDPTLLVAGSAGAAASSLNATPAGTTAPAATASPDGVASSTVAVSPSGAASASTAPTTIAARPAQDDGGILPWLLWLLPLGLLGLFLLWLNSRRETSEEDAGRSIEPVAPLQPTPPETAPIPPANDLTDPWVENPNLASRAESVVSSDRAASGQPAPVADPTIETTGSTPNLGDAALAAGAGAAALADRTDSSDISSPEEPSLTSGTIQPTELTVPVVESPISADDSTAIAGAALASGAVLAAGAAGMARSEDPTPEISLDVSPTSLEEPSIEDLEIEEALSTFDTIDDLDVDFPSAIEDPIELDLDGATSASGLGDVSSPIVPAELIGGAALAVEAAALMNADDAQSEVEAAKFDVGQTDLSSETLATVDEGLSDLPEGYGESRIVLLPRDPQWGYTYWDISNEHKSEARQQGGQNLVLRLCDVTDIEVDRQSPHTMQQFDCDEMARDWYLAIPVSDRDYLVEIGYLTADGRWLMLARSTPVRIPPTYPSDWAEDQFVTIDWQEDLRGKTFLELVPPSRQTDGEAVVNPIYDQLFDTAQSAEEQRVTGSLFGSMQQVPQQSVSSFVFAPGARMSALPTVSGIGMSGIGMSGIGMSASVPPIRPRNFWLIADAELIVYGATEPDAKVTIDGNPIQLNPDGTFRFQLSFQDGVIRYPIIAVAADGEQMRSIHMKFTRETPQRNTNTKNEAQDEWLF